MIDKLSWRLFYEAGRLVWQPLILNLSEISYVLSKTAAFNGALLANFKKSLSQNNVVLAHSCLFILQDIFEEGEFLHS